MPGMMAGASNAVTFGVYAALAYDIMSSTNSSPQTTELFAGDRSETLMKYVKIGDVQIVAFGLFGSLLEGNYWPLAGCVSVGLIMHCMYQYALNAGIDTAPPVAAEGY